MRLRQMCLGADAKQSRNRPHQSRLRGGSCRWRRPLRPQRANESARCAHKRSVKKSVKKMEVTFKVYRKEPGPGTKPGRSDYKLELGNDATVLDGLLKIRDEVDGTLAFRAS